MGVGERAKLRERELVSESKRIHKGGGKRERGGREGMREGGR